MSFGLPRPKAIGLCRAANLICTPAWMMLGAGFLGEDRTNHLDQILDRCTAGYMRTPIKPTIHCYALHFRHTSKTRMA
ncbi:hypothetical protein DEA98_10820 [Brucella pseudogrignonensis]|nr:hypothetical protein [Brucella pseudogrignonensis]NKX16070.1 hypothetical protein [Brucella pseudogrignonensis]